MKQIPLHGKDGIGKFALVDDEYYNYLMKWRWFGVYKKASCNYYTVCNYKDSNNKWSSKTMHWMIMGKKEGFVIDHIDGNGLNNQKSNLRHCTALENSKNRKINIKSSSGFKGVTFQKSSHRFKDAWVARINIDGKSLFLGSFSYTEEGKLLAAKTYNKAAIKHHKEFAALNSDFPIKRQIEIRQQCKKKSIEYANNLDGTISVPLSKGQYAIIDKNDLDIIKRYTWHAQEKEPGKYVASTMRSREFKPRQISMHQLLLGKRDGFVIDHVNRNSLDNRRENLRYATPKQNQDNISVQKTKKSSKYFGVFYHDNAWQVTTTHYGKIIRIGRFPYTKEGEVQAALAYNKTAKELKGEFAHINVILP